MNPDSQHALPVAVALCALVLAVGFTFLWPGGNEQEVIETAQGPLGDGNDTIADLEPFEEAEGAKPSDRIALKTGEERIASSERKGIPITGRVIDRESRETVTEFHIKVFHLGKHDRQTVLVDEIVRHENGQFDFRLNRSGPLYCDVTSSRHWTNKGSLVVPFEGLRDHLIELDTGPIVCGRVVVDATHEPVAGALVGFGRHTILGRIESGNGALTPHARTDEAGGFRLSGLPEDMAKKPYQIAALHSDFAQGHTVTIPVYEKEIEIRLEKGFCVYGRVKDDRGIPLPGATIAVRGKALPLSLSCASGTGGRYRVGRILPGSVSVVAKMRTNGVEDNSRFTPESRQAEIVDEDVEVNFGPSPHHVTYKGTVIDYDGEPLAGASVRMQLKKALDPASSSFNSSTDDCGGKGKFQIGKLVPGTYEVQVGLPGQHGRVAWGQEVFDHPGIFEREIDVAGMGGALFGFVVNKATGFPPHEDSLGVWMGAYHNERKRDLRSYIDLEDGSFALRALAPGKYLLKAMGVDCESKGIETIDLEEGQVISGLRMEVSFTGALHLVFNGFNDTDVDGLTATITGSDPWPIEMEHLEKRDLRERLYAGDYEIRIAKDSLGCVYRSFTIEASRTTHLVVDRGEMIPLRDDATINGRVTHGDGTPAAGIELSFVLKAGKSGLKTRADSSGRYACKGIVPGRWEINGFFEKSERSFPLPDLFVPEAHDDLLNHNLVIPSGTVSGVLHNSLTRLPIDGQDAKWCVRLIDPDRNFRLVNSQSGRTVNRFRLIGVCQGNYVLNALADGYRPFLSEPFEFAPGADLDMGQVFLDPTGILDLHVVDSKGDPVPSLTVYDAGTKEQIKSQSLKNRSGVRRCGNLPVGRFRYRVEARGFKPDENFVDLLPAKPVDVRIVLERK